MMSTLTYCSAGSSVLGEDYIREKRCRCMSDRPDARTELQARPQWVCWLRVRRGDKDTKPPCNPNVEYRLPLKERLADLHDPATWGSYEQAARMRGHYHGIGFMFTPGDGYCGIDLDHCRDPRSGAIEPWARGIIARLGSYTETSPSGTGVHIIVKASLLAALEYLDRTVLQHKRGNIELYDSDRYFTWTGNHLSGTPTTIESRQDELNDLYRELFPQAAQETDEEAPAPAAGIRLTLDDAFIVEQAGKARGGNGLKFARLWSGDASAYRRTDGSTDESRADLALCGILAYWTQKDPGQMDRLFRRSGLYRKERWDQAARSGETYGQGTIREAILHCRQVYDPAWAEAHRNRPRQRRTTGQEASEQNLRKRAFPQDRPADGERMEGGRAEQ